jgi:rhomboid protease GluP
VFVAYNLLYGLKGGVDNAAHIGGLLSGIVMGFALYPALRQPERSGLRLASMALPVVLFAGLGWWVLRAIPGDDGRFNEQVAELSRLEKEGLAMFDLGDEADGSDQLKVLEERSAPAWDSAVALMERAGTLDLSPRLAAKRDILLEYAREQRRYTGLVRQALTQPDPSVDAAMQESQYRIQGIVDRLGQ